MLKLSPCIEMLWNNLPFPERIKKAAALNFPACEFWGWGGKDLDAIEKAVKETGIAIAASCVDTGFEGGASMLNGGGKDPFIKAVKDCIPVGKRIGCSTFIVTTGNTIKDVPRADQHKAFVDALKAGAPAAEDAGLTLVVEPLNVLVDHKGYYLSTSEEAFQMIDEVASPAVKLLFDIYHQQITEGNVTRNIENNIGKIGHFHVADNPGRKEPGTGEINYRFLFKKIADSGYQKYVGLEFSASKQAETDAILKGVQALAG